ncbi:MAG: hypothetical protein G01um10145_645 [Microgenomates group bacterium Gr01-1014_5]|nr:MAG: hypothetical protein G01um10145_645 [Microgenomates group bacterium Gr01-1014_5]
MTAEKIHLSREDFERAGDIFRDDQPTAPPNPEQPIIRAIVQPTDSVDRNSANGAVQLD